MVDSICDVPKKPANETRDFIVKIFDKILKTSDSEGRYFYTFDKFHVYIS